MNDGGNNEILLNSGCSNSEIDYNNTIVLACPVETDKHWWLQYDLKLSSSLMGKRFWNWAQSILNFGKTIGPR